MYTFFCYGKPLLGGMHCDRANTIGIGTVVDGPLIAAHIVNLVSVTCGIDEVLVSQVMEVISFERGLAQTFIESHRSPGQR